MDRPRVLLLEDDKWLAESLFESLKKDFEVRIAHDPERIFGIMENWWPDVMLADVVLGAKNLFMLLNEMQSYDDTREVPIVILSSIAQQFEQQDVKKFAVKKILDKAEITPEILRESLFDVINNSQKAGTKDAKNGALK